MTLPLFRNAMIDLNKLQDWLELQIASVDIFVDNNKNISLEEKQFHFGQIEAFEFIKIHIHELVK